MLPGSALPADRTLSGSLASASPSASSCLPGRTSGHPRQPCYGRSALHRQRRLRQEACLWSSLSPESAGLPVLAAPPTASHTAAAALSLRAFSAATLQRSLAAHARSIDAAAQPLDRRRERGAVLTALAVATIQAFDYSCYQRLDSDDIDEAYLWRRMQPTLSYLPPAEQAQVQRALALAYKCHAGQKRKSGEPFITHPVEVALILARLRMDAVSVVAGLLHDTVEDCDMVSFSQIEAAFGAQVRVIVEGETRFSKVTAVCPNANGTRSRADAKALDLQQLFVAMTKELRIAVVKLADRLHNMRTLGSMRPDKQAKIAHETLQVFAPLARMLGLHTLVVELEDLSFAFSQPDDHRLLQSTLTQIHKDQKLAIEQAQDRLQHALEIDATLCGRQVGVRVEVHQRSLYSVYRKLMAGGPPDASLRRRLKDLRNIPQLRVILDLPPGHSAALYGGSAQLCYHCLGLVHAHWTPVPGSIKDYIATPKSNGYKSLHTTVLPIGTTQDLFPVEVQIRTSDMHREAEFGIAGENFAAASHALHAVPLPTMPASRGLPSDSFAALPKELVQQILRLTPFGLAHSFLGAPSLPVNGSSGLANGHLKTNGTVQEVSSAAMRLDEATMARRVQWLKAIREWQDEFVGHLSAAEFVDCIIGDLMGKSVFVFTPLGDLLRLPKGATVVDFAYHVHTEVGNQMVSARVNGKPASVAHVLGDADVVEIRCYQGPPTPCQILTHQKWLAYTATKAARHKLSRFVRENLHLPVEAASCSAHNPQEQAAG